MENMCSNRKCAEVVYAKSPHNFWIRLEEYKNDYTEMLSQLQAEYEDAHENPELTVSDPQLGSKYCTFNQQLFEWHRCEILIVNKSDVYISYIDNGRTDLIPLKSIKKLKSSFQVQPSFALHCTLDGVKPSNAGSWSLDSINEFNKLALNKIVTLNIKSKVDNIYHADLFVKNVNIGQHLIKNGFGQSVQADLINLQLKISNAKFDFDQNYDITISTIYSPFCFFVQINNFLNDFYQFESELQEFYQNVNLESQKLTNIQIGVNCVAKFSEDQQWYRAMVKEVNEKLAKVVFVDYGNEEIVKLDEILKLDSRFASHPTMAIKCCLDGVKPPSDGFLEHKMQEVSDFMFNSMVGHVSCCFTGKKLDDSYLVHVKVDSTNFSDMLIQNSLVTKIEASPLKKIPVGKQTSRIKSFVIDGVKRFTNEFLDLQKDKTYEIVITHIETFSEFYFKLKETETIKNSINNIKYFYEKKVNLPQPALIENYPCVYHDYEAKEWHRAKIVHVYDQDHCLIRLVDTGRTRYSSKRELREIYDKFLETQCQSSIGCLDGMAQLNDDEVDETILFKFKEIALNRKFLAKVMKKDKIRDLDRYWLNLFDESSESVYHMLVDSLDNSVLDLSQKFKPQVKSNLEETQVTMLEMSTSDTETKKIKSPEYYFYEPLKLDSDSHYSINISNYDSINNFHAQLNSEFGAFDEKFDEFQQSCECGVRLNEDELNTISDISRLAVGAKFYEDDLWYRAKILSIQNKNEVMLEFVDYGNCQSTKIEQVVYLNKEFAKYAPTAVKINKVLYTEQLNLSEKLFEQLILYGSLDQTDKVNWTFAMFRNKNEIIIDDFYALLYQIGILKPDYYIHPSSTDAIMNDEAIGKVNDILDVKLTNIEHGLKHIYFNLKACMPKIESMKKLMIPLVEIEELNSQKMFLIKYKENFFRCRLLSKNGKNKYFFYIDYGKRGCLEPGMKCYMMPLSLYQFHKFAIHCRLTLADNIEKVWTREEKEKFLLKIKPGNDYQIKLLTKSEPFIVEFFDKNNQIDFQFNQIINRMVQTDYETQSIMSVLDQEVKINNFVDKLDSKNFKICAQSDQLFEKLVDFSHKIAEYAKTSDQRAKMLKQGDMYLSRTRSEKFLLSIDEPNIRDFVRAFYSRILISKKSHNLKIYYIDLGLEDTVDLLDEQTIDYKFLQIPLQFKLQPQFLYELKLNKASYLKKFNSASKLNDFVDSELIGENLESFKKTKFSLDFSQAFSQDESTNQAEFISIENGKNLVDLVIEQSFRNINSHQFLSLISHINSIEDFYLQKLNMDVLLKELQDTIQIKVQTNKLQQAKSLESGKLCVAAFEDGFFYRAKIIRSKTDFIEVFYIDYGNTGKVQADDIREITPDLVDRFPRNFAINCRIDLDYVPSNEELELINSYFLEILDEGRFDVKVKTRLTDNRYNDSGFYLVEMFDAQSKENVIDLFKKKLAGEIEQVSCVQYNNVTISDSLDDDKAIAESLNDDTTMNATTNVSIFAPKNQVAKNDTWETTDLNLKNYDGYDETLTRTLMETNIEENSNEKSELYSTANSSQLENTLGDEEVIKDCFIAFMHSSVDFFIQKSDFDSEIEKIQPIIDQCLDPFDIKQSNMCIGQFKQDGLFYRCKILEWLEDRREAFCELIDFGNRDYIEFKTITKMSDDLLNVKPLALNCSLGFELNADSNAYSNLNDLVNLEIKFDCKLKNDSSNVPILVDLSIAKNGLVISQELLEDKNFMIKINQEIIKNACDEYYDLNSGCKTDELKKNRPIDDDDEDQDKLESSKQLAQNFKTSTQVNMVESAAEPLGPINTNNNDAPSDVLFYATESLNESENHPKNETVDCIDETSWSRNGSLIDNTVMHPKNETVNDFDEMSWSRNNSTIDKTAMHPKNETIDYVDESQWSIKSTNDSNHPKNDTVLTYDQSNWSSANLEESNHPANADASRLNDSSWSQKNSYISHSINEASVWNEDPDQSGFVFKEHTKKSRSNLDVTRNHDYPEYTQILNGYVIHVNSMSDFYFQAEDADLKLMNMRHLIDKCVKKFDKPVKVGDMCVAKYHVDEQMYRAQVIEVKSAALNLNQSINSTLKLPDQTVRIRYIDYGNEGHISSSELFKCESELKQIEPLALKCKLNIRKKLANLIAKLNELKKDSSDIVQYFKVLTGRSKVTVKVLKQIDLDLASSPVNLFINNENICDILVSEALACLTIDSKPTQPLQIKIDESIPEFNANVLNLANEFSKSVKLKNLNILNKIDEFIESLVEQTMESWDIDTINQCLAIVGQNVIKSFKLVQPYVRTSLISRKNNQFECNFIDLDYKAMLSKDHLCPSTHFIDKIQSACNKYDLQLNNSDCILILTSDQKIQLQNIFKDLINYELNSSTSLKVCVQQKKCVRLYNNDDLDINTILEMCINLLKNPLSGRVVHCEPDYSQFDILNELANNHVYKREMSKIYTSTGLFDYQIHSDDIKFKIGSMCLIDCGSSTKTVFPSDSVLSLAEHVIEEEKKDDSSKDICRGVVIDEQDDKCVVLNLDTGKHLTVKKTRLRCLTSQDWSIRVLEKIPFMLIKCKVLGHVERHTPIHRLIHKSRYYGEVIKLSVIDSWTHELDLKGLYKIVKIHSTNSDSLPEQPQRLSTYYTLSHVNSLINFYIHPHDVEKQLKFIQEQIKLELGLKKLKNPPQMGKVYAVKESDKFARVILLNTYVSAHTDIYQAFFIDYGYTKKISLADLILISETVQSIAPQAICCKLYGVDSSSPNFLDASQSINESAYENNALIDQFKQILQNQPFQASIYKQWSLEKKIINFVPLQSDNLKSIEIVIHINGQNLIDYLKQFKQLKTQTKLNIDQEYKFKFINFITSNEFSASLIIKEEVNKKLNDCLANMSDQLTSKDIRTGLVCIFKPKQARALILDIFKIKSELNIKLELVDYGEVVYAKLNDLFKLPENLYELEPLAYKFNLSSSILKDKIRSCKEITLRIKNLKDNVYNVDLIRPDLLAELFETKCIIYNQVKLDLKTRVKVMLTNVDTAKHFGIVQSVNNEKRMEFIAKFHQWHKENKSSLVRLNGDLKSQPCAINSIQVGKWSRGLVVQCDQTANMSNVYLIDFCKTLTVGNDRLYRIDCDEFLNEPSYVHRCFLQEEQEQLRRFSKYIDMLKSSHNDSSGLDNLEILIESLDKVMTPLHVQSNIENYQYKIKVIDVKRVQSSVPQSPNCMLNNSAKINLCHKQVKYSQSFQDETTENILCSTYKENYLINESKCMTLIHSEHRNNDYQSDTFSAITESTRIQTLHDSDNLTLCDSRRREETSNWIKDLEENDEEKFKLYSNLSADQKCVPVRVLPSEFSPCGFLCQRIELKSSYEKLKLAMNDYYQKIADASKSLEKEKIVSINSDFSDSLETIDLFGNSFKRGDYCAVQVGRSWARCLILEINKRLVMIECVDDGRKQLVNLNKLEKLADNFKMMPRYCIKCRFSGLDSKKLLRLDLQVIEKFEKFLCQTTKEFTADIIEVKTDEISGQILYEINLYMDKENVLDLWTKDEDN